MKSPLCPPAHPLRPRQSGPEPQQCLKDTSGASKVQRSRLWPQLSSLSAHRRGALGQSSPCANCARCSSVRHSKNPPTLVPVVMTCAHGVFRGMSPTPPPPLYKLRPCPSYSRRRDRNNCVRNFNYVRNVVRPHKTWVCHHICQLHGAMDTCNMPHGRQIHSQEFEVVRAQTSP